MANGYEAQVISWQEIPITLRMKRNYSQAFQKAYGRELVHVTIRAASPLPITSTGFRSIFLSMNQQTEAGGLAPFVQDILDQAAKSKEWIEYRRQKRQLRLF